MRLLGGSVFSGGGGFDLGFERAGIEPAFQIEIDRFCNRVLKARWPEVERHGDIQAIDPAGLRAVDALFGGFPCQDVSVAGRGAGLAGERSGLFFEFIRLAAALRPRWVVLENVPGLLSSNEGADMATVLGELADLGYGWAYRVLDAQYFGVPQRRRRVFIVGCLGDGRAAAQVLFESEGGGGDPPEGGEEGERPAYALTSRSSGRRLETELKAHSGADGWIPNAEEAADGYLVAEGHDASEDGTGRGVPLVIPIQYPDQQRLPGSAMPNGSGLGKEGDPSFTLETRNRQGVAYRKRTMTHGAEAQDEQWEEAEVATVLDATGRATTLAATLAAKNEPANSAATREEMGNTMAALTGIVRRLTPLEAERLQGFPDGWTCLCEARGDSMTCTCPDSPRYKLLGNAVCVIVAEWIGQRLVAVDATL